MLDKLKNPTTFVMRLFNIINKLGGDLLSHAKSILSLALVRFTALFEMGRGGSKPLWPPSITGYPCALSDFHLIAYHKQKCCALILIFIRIAS